jgi:hypothetical protein
MSKCYICHNNVTESVYYDNNSKPGYYKGAILCDDCYQHKILKCDGNTINNNSNTIICNNCESKDFVNHDFDLVCNKCDNKICSLECRIYQLRECDEGVGTIYIIRYIQQEKIDLSISLDI